jgi:glycosyltransferase involved in cell wall biosynthesis
LRLKHWNPQLLWQLPTLLTLRLAERSSRDPQRPDPFYQQIDADVFCTFGVQSNSARVIASAHALGRPVVLMIGSDGDLDARYTPDSDYVSQYGDVAAVCHSILQQADAIVAQTPYQQKLLRERYGRDSTVIANPFELADWDSRVTKPVPSELRAGLDRYVLWIGRAEPLHKRPQLLLDLARLCPKVDFLMILNPRDPQIERTIHADRPVNVHIVPAVPFDLMPALFSRAVAFVSTSSLEGFPNVFLQAAASGVPIGSLEVGSDFLTAAQAGTSTDGDLDRLADFVRQSWEAPSEPSSIARSYVAEHHDLPTQLGRLRNVLTSVSREATPSAASSALPRG